MSPVRSQPSAVRAGGGGLLVLPVAGEHVRAPHPDLAGVADEDVVAVGVDEADLDAGQRHADRAGLARRRPTDDVTTGDASVSP